MPRQRKRRRATNFQNKKIMTIQQAQEKIPQQTTNVCRTEKSCSSVESITPDISTVLESDNTAAIEVRPKKTEVQQPSNNTLQPITLIDSTGGMSESGCKNGETCESNTNIVLKDSENVMLHISEEKLQSLIESSTSYINNGDSCDIVVVMVDGDGASASEVLKQLGTFQSSEQASHLVNKVEHGDGGTTSGNGSIGSIDKDSQEGIQHPGEKVQQPNPDEVQHPVDNLTVDVARYSNTSEISPTDREQETKIDSNISKLKQGALKDDNNSGDGMQRAIAQTSPNVDMTETQENPTINENPKDNATSDMHKIEPTNTKEKHGYRCSHCNKVFLQEKMFLNHERNHEKERPFACKKCGKAFLQRTHLQIHKQIHSRKKLFHCSKCDASFNQKANLQVHQAVHETNRKFQCDKCNKAFKIKANLKQHELIHKDWKPYKCDVCHMEFRRSNTLKAHSRTHTNERPFPCGLCESAFKQKVNLVYHLVIHSQDEVFLCKSCDQYFRIQEDLDNHQKKHLNDKMFMCKNCDETFGKIQQLKRHEKLHSKGLPYKCVMCPITFKKQDDLRNHIYKHVGSCCRCYCGKTFSEAVKLRKHQAEHKELKPYMCDYCGKRFGRLWLLRSHLTTHSDKKPYSCKICDKTFRQEVILKGHMKIHTDSKGRDFVCDICEKSYTNKKYLENHQAVHTGQKPFKCGTCSKFFLTKGNLQRHEFQHTGHKPYVCSVCQRKFAQKSNLKSHELTHAIERPFSCDKCACSFLRRDYLNRHKKDKHSSVLVSGSPLKEQNKHKLENQSTFWLSIKPNASTQQQCEIMQTVVPMSDDSGKIDLSQPVVSETIYITLDGVNNSVTV